MTGRRSDKRCGECNEPEILEENDAPLAVFRGVQTQWRHDQNGRRRGLEYSGVRVVAEAHGVAMDVETLQLIQVMEHEVVEADRAHAD